MAQLDGVGLRFTESMQGFLEPGETDPHAGARRAREAGRSIHFEVEIRIADLGRFFRDPNHAAALAGSLTFAPLGGTYPIRDGHFELFPVAPESGGREMRYSFTFDADNGRVYHLAGKKEVSDDPRSLDVVEDMTRLFTRIHEGDNAQGPVYGAGELYFRLADAPRLAASIEVDNARSWRDQLRARLAFLSFAYGALRDEYLREYRLFYDARYDNLVAAGEAAAPGGNVPFFFVSGTHDKGFPWGDTELFWDVLLALGSEALGYRRFAITNRVLAVLELDLREGVYRYRGPIFELTAGPVCSFSAMRRGAAELRELDADIEIHFEARSHAEVRFPFPVRNELVRRVAGGFARWLEETLPGENPLGIGITPHSVRIRGGRFRVGVEEWTVLPSSAFGEAEHGRFRNIKEPTLLYHYLCAVRPAAATAHVQIHSGVLRDERPNWLKDRFENLAGRVLSRTSSAEIRVTDGGAELRPFQLRASPADGAPPLRIVGEPVIEINNDHFPTAVFQRSIVRVELPDGESALALEEDMETLRREAIGSDKRVRVASIRHRDRIEALDRVLAETGFFRLIDERAAAAGRDLAALSIVIKPNFMFAYDRRDATTYTDPALVKHLARRLSEHGCRTIHVAEAQSTYGEYFDKRSVGEMAEYLGYADSADYDIVDMTLDADLEQDFAPPLGRHPVSRVWREADFRISFAKNKTHSYAYYTLTLKNIYGALPLANKFREYHCRRGIYRPAIQYLRAYPVDYGLIDAWTSADGPFGIFADPAPNITETVIGGADLVAVDWVGASKMGLDPRISQYMELAVQEFGKPEIELAGDASLYRPWLNVPWTMTLLAHRGMDAEYRFGNLLYMVSSHMDETHFRHRSRAPHVRLLRRLTRPLRETFFVQADQPPTLLNRVVNRLLYLMGY